MNKIENGIADAHATIDAATSAATADKLVKRDANGRFKAAAPAASDDVALKGTVDTHAAITTAPVHGSTSAATPNTLAHRDANGQINVGTPTANSHTATKVYVDTIAATYVPSDNVVLSLPTERDSQTGILKKINITKPGSYRIKGEYKSGSNTSTITLEFRVSYDGSNSSLDDQVCSSLTSTSTTYATFSSDTLYLPGNVVVYILANGTIASYIRNVTLCGDPVPGYTRPFSGTD
jgi:hypothetical protein